MQLEAGLIAPSTIVQNFNGGFDESRPRLRPCTVQSTTIHIWAFDSDSPGVLYFLGLSTTPRLNTTENTSGLNSTKRIIKKGGLEKSFILQNGHEIAVTDFRITTGHDCLSKHLNMIGVAQSPLYKLCDFNEEMDAIHLARCRALSSGSMWSRYWETRH
ncbi:hypothetical protein TNIN_325651 [Trichonephila inaurata madagascariensis]|uniref:Uncharacterized protein n=1 Tax=Trichonephila inaurata madagascariensis TaxID=2747483 RepID=A0A8X6Y611_9ARAC|nr:hypothetical protein TNIN_325651 [Trichonephila inaurata madagascariensis]